MNNCVNNLSFGAHLSLKNASLDKHISREAATKFARVTKNTEGTMVLKKSGDDFLEAKYNGEDFLLLSDQFYKADESEKVDTLVRTLKYIKELIRFNGKEKTTLIQKKAHLEKLDKIAGENKSISLFHDITTDSLRESL